jgi:hypothetical protein
MMCLRIRKLICWFFPIFDKEGIKGWFSFLMLFIFTVISIPSHLHTYPILEFSGYIYEMPIYSGETNISLSGFEPIKIPENIMNLTRFRLKPMFLLGDDSRIEIHYEADLIYSMELQNNFPTGKKTSRQAIDLNWVPYSKGNFSLNHYIDRLYYKSSFDWGDLTIGRQRISWGTGRIWQPTDMFGPINPANFSKFEKDGADAASLKLTLGELSDIETVFNFVNNFAESNYGARFRTNFSEYDVSLMAGYFDETPRVGFDFAGNLMGAGVRGEAVYSAKKDNTKEYVKAILGADYQFSEDLYAMLEFHYNGQGTTCKYCYDLLSLVNGDVMNVGKFYGALQISYIYNMVCQFSAMSIVNIGDGSGLLAPSMQYILTEDVNFRLGGMVFFGSNMGEYSYYSSALYMLGEIYF